MDAADIAEIASLRAQHMQAHAQVQALHKQQRTWCDRIAQLQRADTIARLHPNMALNIGPDPRVVLGVKPGGK
jgi:hypothetical protein